MAGDVTLRTIADRLNVNHGTVSRVLNGRTDMAISQEMRQRILRTAQEMGYRPNKAARALTTGKTHVVALWVPSRETSFYNLIIHRLEVCAVEVGYTTTIRQSGDIKLDFSDILSSPDADGIIAVDVLKDFDALPLSTIETRKPFVLLGVHSSDGSDCVVVDLARGVKSAVGALVASGCRRVAYVTTRGKMASDWDVRYRTFRELSIAASQDMEVIELTTGCKKVAREEVAAYIRERGHPDGILCQNDDIAIGVYRAVADCSLSIPHDVALVGCDGIAEMEYFNPSLSTIAQPIDEMCATAWECLMRRIKDLSAPPQRYHLDAVFVPRDSLRK